MDIADLYDRFILPGARQVLDSDCLLFDAQNTGIDRAGAGG